MESNAAVPQIVLQKSENCAHVIDRIILYPAFWNESSRAKPPPSSFFDSQKEKKVWKKNQTVHHVTTIFDIANKISWETF